jgi:hypothetical protein
MAPTAAAAAVDASRADASAAALGVRPPASGSRNSFHSSKWLSAAELSGGVPFGDPGSEEYSRCLALRA